MNKIEKFISSALHNSSANEAAQALKMAAVAMQGEGVNPSDVLQRKGEKQAHNQSELREAKELAIKWHNVAMRLEEESREIAKAAIDSQAIATTASLDVKKWKNRATILFACGAVAVCVAYGFGKDSGAEQGRLLAATGYTWQDIHTRDQQITALQNQISELKTKALPDQNKQSKQAKKANVFDQFDKPVKNKYDSALKDVKVWSPKAGIYGLKAVCTNSQGVSFYPEWNININESKVREQTHIMPTGYSLSLPTDGAPVKGVKFTLTYQGGTQVACKVLESFE